MRRMIPLAIPQLSGREGEYLQQCITTGFVSSVGPFVERFERSVADAAGAPAAVATASGTSGLHAALAAAGVGRDDLVILPAFTFIASANAIAMCGATPWLFDVSPDAWTLDPDLLARTLAQDAVRKGDRVVHRATGRRVAAILPVHVLGCPADMDPIVACGRDWKLPVVDDAAAALGATYKGRAIATLGSDLTVFSFNGNKTVTAGGGGAVASANEDLLRLVRHLTTTARCGADYDHDRVGFNYRMTNLQAAVGCAQMEQLGPFVAAKRRIQRAYDDVFAALPGTSRFPAPAYADSSCWFSGLVVSDAGTAQMLRARLREDGIDARPFWKPVHLQKPYAASPRTSLHVCESIWGRVVTLPCSVGLTNEEQRTVIASVTRAFA